MNLSKAALLSSALAAGAFLALAGPVPANAHVTLDSSSAAAGSYTVLTFAVSHGCEGSPTTAIAIDIPDGVPSVAPTVNPGWDVEKVLVDAAAPTADSHGTESATRTGQIVYTAKAPLPDGVRDTFAISLKLPDDAAGATLAFPVVQSCAVGETRWEEIATDESAEPQHPAPVITVTAATADAHGGGAVHAAPAAAVPTLVEPAVAADGGDDLVARGLGIGGLVLGAIGIVIALDSRRRLSA